MRRRAVPSRLSAARGALGMGESVAERKNPSSRRVLWGAVALIVLVAVAVSAESAWALGALADADAQKAAIKCQQLIAKTTTKALATKLKAFNTCAAAALACVQTKF